MLTTLRSSGVATLATLLVCWAGPANAVDNLLRITEVMSKPSDLFATPDWFELTNFGTSEINLTGYAVDDNSFSLGQSAFLNSTTGTPLIIQPGESLVFVEGQPTAAAAFRASWGLPETVRVGYYAGSGISFSSGGDGVTLFDHTDTELAGPFGGLIRVSFPAATTGRSFYWNYAADGSLGSASAGTVMPTVEQDPFTMAWTYTLADGVTQETQYATPGKTALAAAGIGIRRWAGTSGDGGSGTWLSPAPLTWRDGVTPVVWEAASIASFPATNATAGTVTLTQSSTAAELDFGRSGYLIAASSTAHTLSLNSGIVNVAGGVTTTITAALDGPVGLAKTGAGLLLLGSPHNQYDGGTSVAFGTLRLTGSGGLPSTTLVSVGLTGVVDLAGRSTRISGLQGLGDLLLGTGTLTIGIPDDVDREHNGNLSGQGSVVIDSAGAGEQAFGLRTSTASKTKSYSGATIVREGTLRISWESAPLGTSGVEVEAGGRLKLSTSTQTGNYFFGINGGNDVSTTVTMRGGTLTHSEGEITQLDNDLVFSGTVNSTLEVHEENAPTPENPNIARLVLAGAVHGSGTAVVRGNGTVVMGADFGVYSGLPSGFTGSLRVGDPIAGGTTTLELAGSVGTGRVLVNATGAVQAAPAVAFAAHTVELAGGELRLDADAGGVTSFDETAVSVTTDSTIAVRRAADVAATLEPTYDLPLTFRGGGLSFTAPTRADTDTTAVVARPTFSAPITLDHDAVVTIVNPTVGTNHVTFTGVVADGGTGRSLAKAGGGGLTLAAANTHTGATVVRAGTLTLAAGGSLVASSRVTVAAGAAFDVTAHPVGYVVPAGQTLTGAGTVAGGAVIGTGATLAPGTSPGTLTITGNATLGAGGHYDWQVYDAAGTAGGATGWDLVSVGGVLDIGATAADRFNLNLWSLAAVGPDVNGDALNFNAVTSGTWRIATAAGGITNFAADKFRINVSATNGTGGFTNARGGGIFSIVQSGNDLDLLFTPAVASTDLVFDVPTGMVKTQADFGYGQITTATSLTKTGGGTLVLDTANPFTGATTIQAGTLQIASNGAVTNSPVTVQSGAAVKIDAGVTMQAPSLTLSGSGSRLDGTGATILVNGTAGIGQLAILSGTVSGKPSLTVSGSGQVSLPTDTRLTMDLTALAIDQATGGKLDIGKGRINIAVGGITAADLRADLVSGRGTGTFSGTSGIVTTGGKASPGSANPAVGYRVFASGSSTVAWAAYGDANLDGQVNFTDINLVNNGGKYGAGASTGAVWVQGDFNYSNGTTLTDITLLNNTGLYNAGSYLPTATAGLLSLGGLPVLGAGSGSGGLALMAAVPEPTTCALAIAGLAAAYGATRLRRRRL